MDTEDIKDHLEELLRPEQGQELTTESSNTNLNDSQVPARVDCSVPMHIATSTFEGAGRGIFVTQDVEAGDLVFSISRPHLSIVSGDSSLFNDSYRSDSNLGR